MCHHVFPAESKGRSYRVTASMEWRHTRPPSPRLPYGRRMELPGRGTTFVRRVEGPPGAPTLLLLHGWMASGGLNWSRALDTLGQHLHAAAVDMRGHGRGIRNGRRFRLADCADDAAATLDA